MYRFLIILLIIAGACSSGSVATKSTTQTEKVSFSLNQSGKGPGITVDLTPGELFYYPLFAIWLEDMNGGYIQTLYVARSVATGIFEYGKQEKGRGCYRYAISAGVVHHEARRA